MRRAITPVTNGKPEFKPYVYGQQSARRAAQVERILAGIRAQISGEIGGGEGGGEA